MGVPRAFACPPRGAMMTMGCTAYLQREQFVAGRDKKRPIKRNSRERSSSSRCQRVRPNVRALTRAREMHTQASPGDF